jgi:hypothetical protein
MRKCIKDIFIVLLLLLKSSVFLGQEDESDEDKPPVKHTLDFSTKGIYVSGGLMFSEIGLYKDHGNVDSIEDWSLGRAYCFQGQFEFKHNLAINAEYSFTSEINDANWKTLKNTLVGINGNFPLYRSYKHHGIYISSGYAIDFIEGYQLSALHPLSGLPYQHKFLKMFNGLGYEYKFKNMQLYCLTRLESHVGRHSIWYDNTSAYSSMSVITGVRIKIPNLYKRINDRYHWL